MMTLPVLDPASASAHAAGGDAFVLHAARAFVHSYARLPADCRALLVADDLPAIAAQAHRIKGAATVLGALRLASSAAALEGAQRAGSYEQARAMTPGFVADLEAALDALNTLVAPPAATAAPTPEQRRLALPLIQRLPPLLAAGDYSATARLDQLNDLLAGTTAAAVVAAIRDLFDQMETDAAAAQATALANELTR